MRISKTRLLTAIVLAIAVGVIAFVASTKGVQVLASRSAESDAASVAEGYVPEVVYDAPDTVPTTSHHGPVGAVSMAFAGTDVRQGLTGELKNPWIAVSRASGAYRAIDAPHRPEPAQGALSVSPAGDRLAWAWHGGVVLYDPVGDEATELSDGFGPGPEVGRFSPDGERLLVYDGALRVVEVGSGSIVATADGIAELAARRAVWTPDGTEVTWVANRRMVSFDWQREQQSDVRTRIRRDAVLAWQPAGERLAAMRSDQGVLVVDVFDVSRAGRQSHAATLRPSGLAMQRLLGFTSDTHVSVVALSAQTGALEQIYRVSAIDETVTPITELPSSGGNWTGAETMAVAADPLANGAAAFDEPRWPWSDQAKLLACVVLSIFLLGLYLTRRLPRRMRKG